MKYRKTLIAGIIISFGLLGTFASASHSWGPYHWARKSNPFTLKLGDNVNTAWDAYLGVASSDWSTSSVLDTTIVTGQAKGNCRPTKGRVEACNKAYGYNGWLGLAQIWVSGVHITQAVVKVNDTYHNLPPYNTPAWKQFVMCQEVGHTFGLDHQDETFSNSNLGTCMDYTNDPDGTLYNQLSNLHPNAHDYEELATIYAHLDSITTIGQTIAHGNGNQNPDVSELKEWGKEIRKASDGRGSLYERDLGWGNKVFTFVIWVR